MHFTVTAADKTSGKEKTIGLTADSRAEVEQWAQGQGLLVSSITQDGPVPTAALAATTDPHNIAGNASILQIVGALVIAVGILAIVAGILIGLYFGAPMWPVTAYGIGFGVVAIGIGAALRMLAAIGLTLRDLARR